MQSGSKMQLKDSGRVLDFHVEVRVLKSAKKYFRAGKNIKTLRRKGEKNADQSIMSVMQALCLLLSNY